MPTDPDSPELPPFKGRIFIDEDGSVVFENLDPGLAEVALELNPEATLACDTPDATGSPEGSSG